MGWIRDNNLVEQCPLHRIGVNLSMKETAEGNDVPILSRTIDRPTPETMQIRIHHKLGYVYLSIVTVQTVLPRLFTREDVRYFRIDLG